MDTRQHKRQVRAEARQRAEAAAQNLPEWSAALCREVLTSGLYRSASTLMLFLPLPPPASEPDLTAVAIDALASQKRLCLPRIDWEAGAMEPAAIDSLDTLVTTRHGVREPAPPPASRPVPIEELDLILVPGLAFDLFGNRLGRGAGFYDRFLAGRQPGAVACGICFESQVIDRIPTDPWDIPVNVLATERRLITLRP
jgi:5-formyltetrahydrofolate cyclo-ligase